MVAGEVLGLEVSGRGDPDGAEADVIVGFVGFESEAFGGVETDPAVIPGAAAEADVFCAGGVNHFFGLGVAGVRELPLGGPLVLVAEHVEYAVG